jgi:hypothetical protein
LRKSLKLPDSELSAVVPEAAAADVPEAAPAVVLGAAAAAELAEVIRLFCCAATEAMLMAR